MKSFFNWGVRKEVETLREQNRLLGEQLDREIAFREDLGRIAKEEMDKTNELEMSLKMKIKLYSDLCDSYDELQTKYDLLEKELIKKNKQLEKTKEKLYSERRDFKIVIKELEKELSKRYIVKTIKPTKPTKQVMGVKYAGKQSKIIKELKESKE